MASPWAGKRSTAPCHLPRSPPCFFLLQYSHLTCTPHPSLFILLEGLSISIQLWTHQGRREPRESWAGWLTPFGPANTLAICIKQVDRALQSTLPRFLSDVPLSDGVLIKPCRLDCGYHQLGRGSAGQGDISKVIVRPQPCRDPRTDIQAEEERAECAKVLR